MRPDNARTELARCRAEVQRLDERCRMLERAAKETKDILKAKDIEIERLRRDLEQERANRKLAEDTHSQRYGRDDRRHPGAPRSLSVDGNSPSGISPDGLWSEMEFRPDMAYAEERAQERSFDAFLTKTDAWSGAQVIQAVHDLNSEILQFAAAATDLCTFDRRGRASPSRPTQAMQDTSERIGPLMTKILVTRDHASDPILVQLALQGCITGILSKALSSFCIGLSTKTDSTLSQLFARVWHSEPQPTSSKWRALTHQHLHTMHPNLGQYAVTDLTEVILRGCLDIFTISGCSKFDYVPFSRESLRTRFMDQVSRMCETVCTLERVSRQEIMSTNFEIISVDRSEDFKPSVMLDAFGDYSTSRGRILCTMDLGLKCTTKKSGADSSSIIGESPFEERMLLQPRVVLESVLDVLQNT